MKKFANNFLVTAIFVLYFALFFYKSFAQKQNDTITTEQLYTYKSIVDSLEVLRSSIGEVYKGAIISQSAIKSVARFKEIKEAKDDIQQLKAMGVTTEEMEAFEKITQLHKALAEEFRKSYTALISDSLGIENYNKIREAVKNDPSLLQRYNAVVQ
ncbi:MAG: hypothetical protein MI674_06190 [Cytophagales bacterium]|nr:hypothetical protein [Cytophagales bacterium]